MEKKRRNRTAADPNPATKESSPQASPVTNDAITSTAPPTCDVLAPAADGETESHGTGVGGATSTRCPRRAAPRRAIDSSTGRGSRTNKRGRGPWLDVAATAAYLDMTERAARDLERRGVLPGHRLGRTVRFDLRELDRRLLACREATLEEIKAGPQKPPSSPLGPLLAPQAAADHMGLPSVEALYKRVWRLQVPVYRLSNRILRFRAVELDRALGLDDPLTGGPGGPILDRDACLPRGKEVSQ